MRPARSIRRAQNVNGREDDCANDSVDKDTLVEFPRYIESLTLLGIGVRTVSFLRVKVYSAGFYADANDMKASFAATASGEEMMKRLVENAATAIRIGE